MEQHGPHLPVGVDTILSETVCRRLLRPCRRYSGGGRADAVVRHGRAPHGSGGTFTFDIPTYRAVLLCLLQKRGAARLQPRSDRQRPWRQHRALSAFLPDIARETGSRSASRPISIRPRRPCEILEDRRACITPARRDLLMWWWRRHRAVRSSRGARPATPPHAAGIARYRSFATSRRRRDRRRPRPMRRRARSSCAAATASRVLRDPATWS